MNATRSPEASGLFFAVPSRLMIYRPLLFALLALGSTACASVVIPEPGSGVYGHLKLESSEPGLVLYQQIGRRVYLDYPATTRRGRNTTLPVYAPICAVPCEADIDVGPLLYVDGKGFTQSDYFRLDPSRGPATFEVKPGSSTRLALSTVGLLLGGGIFGFGGFAAMGGDMLDEPRWITPGFVAMGVGLGVLFTSALLLPGGQTILRPRSPLSLQQP